MPGRMRPRRPRPLKTVEKLKEENKTLKVAAEALREWETKCNTQASAFEKERKTLNDKITELLKKKAKLEQYVEEFGDEMNQKLAEFCTNIELETDRVEKDLNPSRQLLKDSAAMAILQLDEHLDGVMGYITRLRFTMAKIDKEPQPEENL